MLVFHLLRSIFLKSYSVLKKIIIKQLVIMRMIKKVITSLLILLPMEIVLLRASIEIDIGK